MLNLLLAYCRGTIACHQPLSITLFCAKKLKPTERGLGVRKGRKERTPLYLWS